ncbi:hypothetical protein, partial [Fructilactobacillus sanfranciscensis]|uniref:hypothetical protein n=1 Tax=Fructilactobacillus sanfranciscensis TaxID=1625 RepID=UPI0011AF57B9
MIVAKNKLHKIINEHFYFLYNVFFIVGLLYCGLNSTMILHNQHIIQFFIKMIFFIGLLFMLYKTFFIDSKQYHEQLINKESIITFLTISFVFVCGHLARTSDVTYFLIYIISTKNISLKLITKNIIIILVSLIVIANFLSSIGLIENLEIYRLEGIVRFANGFNYTTIYSFTKKWLILFLIIFLTTLSYIQTNTRTDLMLNIILIIILFNYFFISNNFKLNYFIQNIIKCTLLFIPLLIALFTIVTTIFYESRNKMLEFLNNIFSGRLFLVHNAFLKYPPKLIGQYFKQVGNGGKTKLPLGETYFYIDNSFARVLF